MIIKTIDRIKYEDIIDLIQLAWPKQFGEATKNEMIEKMYETNDIKNDINKIILVEDKIIGWCRYTSWPKNVTSTKSIHLMDIIISDAFQGLGYGSTLMKDMIEECRRNGNDYIFSRTFADNNKSFRLHQKNGFIIDFRKEDSIVWKYDLAQVV